ncbi:hypothetical protein MMC17_004203 [Xylographa soralifera]|nr:hypothetical protein [Xylographa soralifera]
MASYARLSASELYLLENWDDSSAEGTASQCKRLLRKYVDVGCAGRWPYHEAARSGEYPKPTEIQIRIILQPTRNTRQREVARELLSGQGGPHLVWLRTHYGQGINLLEVVPFEEICSATGKDDSDVLVLNDRDLYNYDHGWSDLLTSIPEVLDSYTGPKDPVRIRQGIFDAKEEVAPEMEFSGEDWQEDLRERVHHAYVTGALWVQDEESSRSGEMLLLWIDEYGRIVREHRVEAEQMDMYSGMWTIYADNEIEWWHQADVGEAYEHGKWPDELDSGSIIAANAQSVEDSS